MKKSTSTIINESTRNIKASILISILLLTLSVILLFIFSYSQEKFWREFDDHYTYAFFIALLCYFIGRMRFKGRMHLTVLCISIILFLRSGGRSVELYRENQQGKNIEEQVRMINSLYLSADSEAELLRSPEYYYYSKKEYGEGADVLNMLRYTAKFNIPEMLMLQKALKEVDLSEILTAEKLADYNGMAETRLRIKNLIDSLDKNQENVKIRLEKLDERAKSWRKYAHQAYLKNREKEVASAKEIHQALKILYQEVDDLLSFLNEVSSNYILENHQLVFATDEDLQKFNAYYDNILKYHHELQLIQVNAGKVSSG